MNASQLRHALVRGAGIRPKPWFGIGFAVEQAEALICAERQLRIYSWGDMPPERFKMVSVPRSLRKALGRHVRALP